MVREIDSNPKWQKQQNALKKVQVNFELIKPVDRKIRIEAAETGESPSNIIRKVLGLDVKPPVRPRLGVSLSELELQALARKYKVDPEDRRALVRRATEAVQAHYENSNDKTENNR